jgi:hypothetical protein
MLSSSQTGTMVLTSTADDDTMCKNERDVGSYKPPFMAHFEGGGAMDNGTSENLGTLVMDVASGSEPQPSLTLEELQQRVQLLDSERDQELDELRRLYQAKREPIVQALEDKRSAAGAAGAAAAAAAAAGSP